MNPNDGVYQPDPADASTDNVPENRILFLRGQLETANATITRWEAAYRSLADEATKAGVEYKQEFERLNALNVQLTRDVIDRNNTIDVIHRAAMFYVEFFLDTYGVFNPDALTAEVQHHLKIAREMQRRAEEIPM